MDAEVRKRAEALISSIKDCTEYRRFEQARQSLDAQPQKRKTADLFRKKNFLLQNAAELNPPQSQEAMSLEREELRRDPVIDDYLKSELALCRMLRQLTLQLMGSVDLDLDALEDILS